MNGKGVTQSPPELWYGAHSPDHSLFSPFCLLRVLPEWLPFHPRRFWIRCLVVYLLVKYPYGIRFLVK